MTVQNVTGSFVTPASFAQERLWFLEQLEGGDASAYNVGLGFRLTGPLDHAAVDAAVTGLVRRHETLRTTFVARDEVLMQVIDEPHEVRLAETDLSAEPDPEQALRDRLAAQLHRPFDVGTGPVYRVALYRLGPQTHVVLLVLDHIVCDAWSLRVLHRDFVAEYAAHAEGRAAPVEPEIQYADYAIWQRDWLDSGEADRQLAYWRSRLADPPAKPWLGPAAVDGGRRGGTVDRPLPDELVARLKEFGQRANASLFMLVTAAYVTLLRRYSGQDDLIIGTLVANRNQAEVEDLVGFFTNTAALRFDLAGDPSVRDLLARVRETTLGAYAHQDVPFHRVVEELQPRRTPGEPPWFNAMVQLADVEREPATVAGVLIEPLPLTTRPAPVELVVSLVKESGRYRVVWDFYDSTRLREDSVAAMHDRLVRLLDGFTADLDRPVSAIEMLAPGETLPAPAAAAADEAIVDDDRPAPEGPWETLVAEVWAEVLGYDVGEIAATDDFFDLGGHSLAAGRVLNRIARRTGVHLATRVLFDEPQLRALAGALAARSGART
jgi:hypothetical protein